MDVCRTLLATCHKEWRAGEIGCCRCGAHRLCRLHSRDAQAPEGRCVLRTFGSLLKPLREVYVLEPAGASSFHLFSMLCDRRECRIAWSLGLGRQGPGVERSLHIFSRIITCCPSSSGLLNSSARKRRRLSKRKHMVEKKARCRQVKSTEKRRRLSSKAVEPLEVSSQRAP